MRILTKQAAIAVLMSASVIAAAGTIEIISANASINIWGGSIPSPYTGSYDTQTGEIDVGIGVFLQGPGSVSSSANFDTTYTWQIKYVPDNPSDLPGTSPYSVQLKPRQKTMAKAACGGIIIPHSSTSYADLAAGIGAFRSASATWNGGPVVDQDGGVDVTDPWELPTQLSTTTVFQLVNGQWIANPSVTLYNCYMNCSGTTSGTTSVKVNITAQSRIIQQMRIIQVGTQSFSDYP
ncbi:MAG: hypothetical protein KF784_02550 [Fimbriimonadaceae bacterium]|nr:hypothetical protein [Fimbriimonadaceae bacterium]